jgi:hypothetical protein
MKKTAPDYLKYWRVIRYFVKAKYKLTQADLDIILFLYSEKYFDKSKFDEFDELLSWDVKRFNRLLKEGWIQSFRKKVNNRRAVYQLSYKGSRMVHSIYQKLNGEEIPVSNNTNPMFLRKVNYSDKVYRNMIKEMNAATRQQRHQTPE